MSAFDLERFIASRAPRWQALEEALNRHAETPAAGGRAGMQELLRLARTAAADLLRARSRTANPALLDRLDALVGRAWRELHGAAPIRHRFRLGEFLTRTLPQAIRARQPALAACLTALLIGAVIGFAGVISDPDQASRFIPAEFFSESVADRVEKIETGPERVDHAAEAAHFASFLYTHNIQVALLACGVAATTLIGGLLLVAFNGVILGAVAAQYVLDGETVFFLAWVGPHGALELPGILIGAAAGLVIGRALWLPGGVDRATALRRAAPDAWHLLVTAALILVGAGFIEGSFSQMSSRSIPYGVKIAVAGVLHLLLLAWLFGLRWKR